MVACLDIPIFEVIHLRKLSIRNATKVRLVEQEQHKGAFGCAERPKGGLVAVNSFFRVVGVAKHNMGRVWFAVLTARGNWEGYGIAVEGTWDSGLELETVGKAGMVLAGRGLRRSYWVFEVDFVCTMAEIGCNWLDWTSSLHSLWSIAHKWAVKLLEGHLIFHSLQ
ncbi:hypothetical protein Tco_0385396 [Tanacetum coccineum]